MDPGIVIRGGIAFLVDLNGWNATKLGPRMPQGELMSRILEFSTPPKDFFPVPQGVRMFKFAGPKAVLVVELEPAVRSFQWIKDLGGNAQQNVTHLGPNAQYEERDLALPFVVLILPFFNGVLQAGFCQAFYRREPLSGWEDQLLMTNLLNTANGYGFTNWLCMVGYQQKQGLSWEKAVEGAVRYFLWSAFNRSSEVHEHNSHYGTMRAKGIDPRVLSVAKWEQESRAHPRFMLEIPWPETGPTVRSALELSWSKTPDHPLNLITLLQESPKEAT